MRIARVDANQAEITKQLREWGASVAITSMVGKGMVDILVGHNGFNFMFEIKDPSKPPSKRVLTPDEQKFFDNWCGQCAVIHNFEEAKYIIENFRSKFCESDIRI